MKALLIKIRQILRDRRTRQFLTRFVSVTAAIVVFVTTYALVLPAITMESQAACGIEAHQHDDSCYTEELICGQEESEGHHHTEECYTVTRELVCSFEEHQHSSENGCYDEDGNLICTLEEHAHTDSCYEEHRELTCGLEESEGHHHTDFCYEKVLTCGKEVHIHSAECYRENQEVQSAAVASTGITSMPAAAAPRSDEGFFSEDVQDEDAGSETLAEPGQINVEEESDNQDAEEESVLVSDDESADKESVNEDISASDAEHVNADNDLAADDDDKSEDHDSAIKADKDADEEKPADNVNENTDNENIENEIDTDGEGEDAASSFSTGFAADENEENGDVYVPEKEELNFNTVLNRGTGIYYHHVTEDEMMEDSSVITDWVRADEDTELRAEDLSRLYLSYTLPVDSINATNDIARYRLPDTLHLTDDQIDSINECENGISGQYVNFDTLEITDPERHAAYLGLESVEGTRRPDEELKEGSQEFISATVRAEKVYNEDNGEYEGTDLVFTFSPYAVEKNAHAYDKDGQPTRAGEKLSGWLTLDFNMSQIEWAEDSTSEVVFTEEDPENSISRLSTVLKLADPSESAADDSAADGTTEEAAADTTEETATTDETAATDETAEAAGIDETAEAAATDETSEEETAEAAAADETAAVDETAETAEAAAEDNTAEAAADVTAEAENDSEKEKDKNEDPTAAEYPAAVFEDSITVSSGRLDTDLADTTLPKKTKMTVHVEVDEGTFPEGTKMVLSPVEDLDAVAEAVGTAVDGKTRGFQAVDIAFYDKDPSIDGAKEIEPLKPIRVSIKSDEIKKAAGDASTAPVVVHVEDSTGEKPESSKSGQTGTNEGSLIDASMGSRADEADVLTFEAASFSVYAVVYTVELNATVLSTSGETYEITVNCGENAGIPETAELRVKEILPEESEYSTLRSDIEEGLSSSDVNAPVNPVMFDISIWDGDREIEPAEGSEVKVEIKLVRDSLKGMFTDENTPLLINEKPIQVENGYVEKSLQVIHQAQDGKVSVMDSFDNIGDEQVISTFSTSSFSNWLVFLDETADNITIGIGDTLTLRPYKEWSWDDPSEQGDAWIRPANNPIFRNGEAAVRTVTDNNMGQTYTLYEVEPVQTGSFNIQTTTGRTIHVTVQQTSPEADGQKPATVTTVNNADEGITFNLYDYDRDMTLDESSNKAAYWTAWNTNNVSHNDSSGGEYTYNQNKQIYHNNWDFNYNTSINSGHYLKFLGWGYSSILSSTHWSKGILDYTGTTVTPKIVSSDLVEVTLTDGTKFKVPKLRNFNENLAYLFNPKFTFTNTNGAVQAYANADGLFQKGSNGYYYYNHPSAKDSMILPRLSEEALLGQAPLQIFGGNTRYTYKGHSPEQAGDCLLGIHIRKHSPRHAVPMSSSLLLILYFHKPPGVFDPEGRSAPAPELSGR